MKKSIAIETYKSIKGREEILGSLGEKFQTLSDGELIYFVTPKNITPFLTAQRFIIDSKITRKIDIDIDEARKIIKQLERNKRPVLKKLLNQIYVRGKIRNGNGFYN